MVNDYNLPKDEPNREIKIAILDALNSSWGIDNAISAENLQNHVIFATRQENIDNRQIRNYIKELRDAGHLICSLSGGDKNSPIYNQIEGKKKSYSGYFRPVTLEEYRRYRSFHVSYAKRIFETIRAMDRAAEKEFPYELQPGLFDDLKALEVA